MGAFNGGLTVFKFHVEGELPEDFRGTMQRHIRQRTFQPLTVEEEVDARIGWTVAGAPLDLDLKYDKFAYNDYVCLGVRIDKWRIPKPVLNAAFEEAARERLKKLGKEHLSRTEKEELKLMVTSRLRKQVIPTMRAIDFVWNVDTMVAWFWSHSESMHEQLSVLFEQTFGLDLVQDCPFISAEKAGYDTDGPLGSIKQTVLAAKSRARKGDE